jgi:DNA ligase-associated metallophosphoesterase
VTPATGGVHCRAMERVRVECEAGPTAGADGSPAADLLLLAGRGALLPASRTLLVADLHLGKAATFRDAGIPVPEGSAQRDLERLARLVASRLVRRVLVLGDLFHAGRGCTPAVFEEFAALRERLAGTEVVLVRGNHDRSIGRLPAALGIDACLPRLDEPPFHFVHDPLDAAAAVAAGRCVVAGHVHPTVAVRGTSGDRLADRCFVAREGLVLLPAFGSFTGGSRVAPEPGMRIWLARDDGVVEVTAIAAGRRRG